MPSARLGSDQPRPPFLERVTARQWVIVDVVIAGAFLLGGTLQLFLTPRLHGAAPDWVIWPFYVAASVPVAFRRRWPEAALVCVSLALTATTLLGNSLAPAPVLALPLYTVTVKYSRRQSLLVLAVVESFLAVALLVTSILRPIRGDVTSDIILAAATWFVGDSVRTRRAYQAGLVEQAGERQRQELDRAQRAVAEERMEIARELHDVIAHSLSVIAIQSGVGRHVIDDQPGEAKAALSAIEDTSRSALHELRRVLGVLRRANRDDVDLAPAPTLADLDDLVDNVRGAGIPIDMACTGTTSSLPQGLELSVYRIVQEALTNVVKHAPSASTWISIDRRPDTIEVTVTNRPPLKGTTLNGGLDHGKARDGRAGHGIIGMAERAAAFGGTLTASPLPDGGFEVHALLPLSEPS
jgi:signal transduction histidine kinase